MRIVSSKSDEEWRRKETSDNLIGPLRDLTANLLRITRGAGNPNLLVRQMDECLNALAAYAKEHGSLPPPPAIQEILDPDATYRAERGLTREETEREMALRQIRRGALQAVAAMLLGHHMQYSGGERSIYDGIHAMDEFTAKQRALYKKGSRRPEKER
jgi:hypothetical protein